MNLPLAHSLALSLHSTHPLSCRFLAGLNESFPTRCGRSCGMPFLLENRPKTVKKISRGAAPDPLSLPISGRAPRQSGPLAEAQRDPQRFRALLPASWADLALVSGWVLIF